MSEQLTRKAYELGVLDGALAERERIIALLNDLKCEDLDFDGGEECYCGSWIESVEHILGEPQ